MDRKIDRQVKHCLTLLALHLGISSPCNAVFPHGLLGMAPRQRRVHSTLSASAGSPHHKSWYSSTRDSTAAIVHQQGTPLGSSHASAATHPGILSHRMMGHYTHVCAAWSHSSMKLSKSSNWTTRSTHHPLGGETKKNGQDIQREPFVAKSILEWFKSSLSHHLSE